MTWKSRKNLQLQKRKEEEEREEQEKGRREREKESQTSKKLSPFLYMCFGLFAANDLAKIKHHY